MTYAYNEWNRLVETTHSSGVSVKISDSGSQSVANGNVGGTTGTLKPVGTEEGGVQDTVRDPNGHIVSIAKDARGYVGATTDASGGTTQIVRNLEGKPTKITRPDGSIQTFEYDPIYGDLIRQTDTATGITTSQTFDDYGNLLSITNGRGYTYQTQYDDKGLITAKTDPLQNQTIYTYNAFGQALTSRDPLGNVRFSTYDAFGNPLTQGVNGRTLSTFTYDAAGNVLTSQDANGHVTQYEHDFLNRLTAVTTPKQERTEYLYARTGELTQIKDAVGNITSMEYDSLGRLTQKTDSLGMITRRWYDANGNVIREQDPNGNIKSFEYNADNKLILKTLPDNVVSLSYDERKNLLQAKDKATQVDFGYDEAGRLISAASAGFGELSSLPPATLSFTRDENGNRTQLVSPWRSATYSYDALDRLTSLQTSATGGYGFGYDNASRLTSISRPGSVSRLTFDGVGFLQSLVHGPESTPIASYTLTRDATGNITQVAGHGNAVLRSIAYDANNQVVSASNPEASGAKANETFAYDAIYNRKQDQEGAYRYDAKSQRLEEDYRYFYFYDSNGNLTSKQGKGVTGEVVNYSYSSENQLISIRYYQPASGSWDPSHLWTPTSALVKEVRYFYDALGRRVKKIVVDHAAETDVTRTFTRQYAYDGQEILTEFDGSGSVLAHYAHSGLGMDDVLGVEVTSAGVAAGLAQASGVYQYLKDSLGSILDVTDSAGNRIQHYVYSAFGTLLGIQDALANDVTAHPPLKTSYGFTGRELDQESGLMYYRARYYDPTLGRFLQKDPHPGNLNSPGSITNSYAYVENNPYNFTDPSGKFLFVPFLIAFAVNVAISAAVGAVVAGAIAGVVSMNSGHGFFSGFLSGAGTGAIQGAITGAITFGLGASLAAIGASEVAARVGTGIVLGALGAYNGISSARSIEGKWAGGLLGFFGGFAAGAAGSGAGYDALKTASVAGAGLAAEQSAMRDGLRLLRENLREAIKGADYLIQTPDPSDFVPTINQGGIP